MKRRIAIVLVLACSLAGAAWAAEKYPVELHRPLKKGAKYRQTVVATQAERTRMWAQNSLQQDEAQRIHIELTADTTVTEADAKGLPVREKHMIRACTVTRHGQKRPIDVLSRGNVVEAWSEGGHDMYRVDGKEPDSTQRLVLSLALPVLGASVTDDEMFGTDRPREINDPWPVHPDGIARVLNAAGLAVGPDSIRGDARITEVKGKGKKAVLGVQTRVTVEPFVPPLAKGLKVEKARMVWEGTTRVPAIARGNRLGDESKLQATFRASGKASSQSTSVRVESQSVQEIKHTYEYRN